MSPRHALVTGATGFIGRHLCRHLLSAGWEVTALVRASSDRSGLEGCRFAVGDILDPQTLAGPVRDADAVFHLASLLKAPWMAAFQTVNVGGSRNVAAACAAAPAPPVLVLVSTLAAGGPAPGGQPRTEADAPAPVSQYGAVKLAAEAAAVALAGDVPVSIVRPPMVFGPQDRTALRLFRSVSRGLHLVPSTDPVSLIHVADLVDGLRRVAARGERAAGTGAVGSGVYYLAREDALGYDALGLLVGAAVGRRPTVLQAPRAVLWAAAALGELGGRLRGQPSFLNRDKYREITSGPWVCSAQKAAEHLGCRSEGTLEARLEQTARWYQEAGWLR